LMVLSSYMTFASDRGLNTDRPDKTESAYTVDKGRFQFETDLMFFTQDKSNSSETNDSILTVNNINLKFGILENSDLQIIVANYLEDKSNSTGQKITKKGFGDSVIRLKHNLFGNDSGDAAFGVMPFLKLPTAAAGISNERAEGGVILPLSIKLPNDWSFGFMVEVDHLRRQDDMGWQTDYVMSGTVSHSIVGPLSGFFELYHRSSDNANQGSIATLDMGLLYLYNEKIQFDTGAFFGLTENADDLNLFLGLSVLF
jgi:hypothetical protein